LEEIKTVLALCGVVAVFANHISVGLKNRAWIWKVEIRASKNKNLPHACSHFINKYTLTRQQLRQTFELSANFQNTRIVWLGGD